MKRLTLTLALIGAFATSYAQLAQDTTPPLASTFEYKVTSDKSVLMALNLYTLHEVTLDLPWGFDFSAGHGVWLGSRSNLGSLGDAQAVLGYEWYGLKDIGGDGFYVKAGAGLCIGPRTDDHSALTGYLFLSGGKKF